MVFQANDPQRPLEATPVTLPTIERRSPDPTPEKQDILPSMLYYFGTDLDPIHASYNLVICFFVSGLVDSTVYDAWGCFVSMQTGNTIFIALGASSPPSSKPYGWAKSLVSLISFLIGCVFFSHASRFLGPLRRGTLVLSFWVQTCLMIASAALVQAGKVSGKADGDSTDIQWLEILPLAFLSFQSAGQIVSTRFLGITELSTVVLTSLYCDLVSDPLLLAPLLKNEKRNRRACGQLALLGGAIAGGWISLSRGGMAAVLWLAAGLKGFIAVSWIFWKEMHSTINSSS
ncbi:MAG: hypothetical protein M1834_004340 [Cirrosporium novae-zelandiae]|nr:MAG: hypothetical protein M1834_004340 [Cirrosporium novae-zelandiae]